MPRPPGVVQLVRTRGEVHLRREGRRRLHHARRRAPCTGRRADKSCAERLLAELVRLVLGARAGVGRARRGVRGERRRERRGL